MLALEQVAHLPEIRLQCAGRMRAWSAPGRRRQARRQDTQAHGQEGEVLDGGRQPGPQARKHGSIDGEGHGDELTEPSRRAQGWEGGRSLQTPPLHPPSFPLEYPPLGAEHAGDVCIGRLQVSRSAAARNLKAGTNGDAGHSRYILGFIIALIAPQDTG